MTDALYLQARVSDLEKELRLEREDNQQLRRDLIEAQNALDHEKWLTQASAELVEADDEKKLWELYLLKLDTGIILTHEQCLESAANALKVWKERK